jgi:hypothetical protein
MPSLLEKTSFYDPDTGRQFVVGDDGFYWKKACIPEEFCPQCGSDAQRCRCPNKADLLDGETVGDKLASPATTAVNNAGKGHGEVEGELPPEAKVGTRRILHDDAGAQTGLRSRPDYGESDSYTVEMNGENSKEASTIVLTSTDKTASAPLYVSAVEYDGGNSFRLAKFRVSADRKKALALRRVTAVRLAEQVRLLLKVAKPGDPLAFRTVKAEESLNGFSIMSLDDFVTQGLSHVAAEGDEVQRDEPATEQDFGLGAKHRELSDEEMREYMERVENRAEYEAEKDKNKGKGKGRKSEEEKAEEERVKSERQKDKFNLPILHRGNIHIVNEGGKEYDLDRLKKDIMKRPDHLLKKNEKMQHSGITKQYYNIGLPALKGLVVNEKTGKFVVVDTCPGAGICKTYCYAMRGGFVQFSVTSLNTAKILNFLVNHPDKFKAMLKAEIALAESKMDEGTKVVIRWHDAGDFFSPQYMNMAFDIARSFPDVEFYAYTKMGDVVNVKKPDNFIISFSEGALPSEVKKVDLTQIKSSITVPQQRFWDLIVTKGAHVVKDKSGQVQFKSKAAWDEFKDRLVEDYKIKKDTILHYNEYMKKKKDDELGDKPKWNVVVPPGGGDDAANDRLVIGAYLMWH